jgi:hypothetical protein
MYLYEDFLILFTFINLLLTANNAVEAVKSGCAFIALMSFLIEFIIDRLDGVP